MIQEIISVAGREKISKYIRSNDLTDLLAIINAYCQNVNIKASVTSSSVRDPKDLYLLSLAETVGADYIVSGDADLTELNRHKQTQIISLNGFKNIIG